MRIGIDTGGTFTDLVFLGEGEGRVLKVPSTPGDPLKAILNGLQELRPEGLNGVEVVHGTTVGTNAFLERRGARVVLPKGPAYLPLYYRPRLAPGYAFWGPALVVEDYATLLVLPGFRGEVLPQGHVLLTRPQETKY